MQNLLACRKKVKYFKTDRAADDVNVIYCHIMNGTGLMYETAYDQVFDYKAVS